MYRKSGPYGGWKLQGTLCKGEGRLYFAGLRHCQVSPRSKKRKAAVFRRQRVKSLFGSLIQRRRGILCRQWGFRNQKLARKLNHPKGWFFFAIKGTPGLGRRLFIMGNPGCFKMKSLAEPDEAGRWLLPRSSLKPSSQAKG